MLIGQKLNSSIVDEIFKFSKVNDWRKSIFKKELSKTARSLLIILTRYIETNENIFRLILTDKINETDRNLRGEISYKARIYVFERIKNFSNNDIIDPFLFKIIIDE